MTDQPRKLYCTQHYASDLTYFCSFQIKQMFWLFLYSTYFFSHFLSHIKCPLYFCYRLLDLDMVVRDEQGNILNPDITSTIQLYWQHELATERIRKATVSFKKFNMKF